MFSKSIMLLCVCNLVNLILSNEKISLLTSIEMYPSNLKCNAVYLNFQFKFNPVDEEWKRNKCESMGLTFIKNKEFESVFSQKYKIRQLYKVLSDLICGDTTFSTTLQENICSSIKTNDDIKKLFPDEESFNNYLNDYIIFKNPDEADECSICYYELESPVILNKCHHYLCKNCADKLVDRNEKKCPLCRTKFSYYIDEVEGNVVSSCSLIEYYAAAYYLDVCIFLFMREGEWAFFDKNGPNYTDEDMENKKCIYLFKHESEKTIGVVVETRELSLF
ncbi:RING finger protein PFF0165c-like isoform X2 [Daktulosphaira vitifoliae]|uniref:RING finger protein PFF0165c-like isoform X2 n=1 Tax=Daktulosphaira vitifoliae TaxID=58002 RepID=UPI0021AA2AF4|nr:RING finger protein PFF0165c-like isoform X2 [Daktulosphaira vitifoliae]